MEKYKLLVIDDDDNLRDGLISLLESKGYATTEAASAEIALQLLENNVFDLILTDFKMQKMDGMRLLQTIKKQLPSSRVIMMTGFGSIEHAVEAMQSGATNYLTKPVNPQKLFEILERTLVDKKEKITAANERRHLSKLRHFHDMVGMSKPMQDVYRKIQEVAGTDISVLIHGESGTGKELVAKAIHDLSPRKNKNYVAVNTGAIPGELIASELFGHLKGSFTGAISDKKGKFEEANDGTLFLDEIGTMQLPVQISLLRVLETHMVERVGSNKSIRVNVRIICASNENLQQMIESQKFREDLYYRLNVFAIDLPPLRNRKADIPYLIKYYRNLFNLELNKDVKGCTKEALEALKTYAWPGNVRELRNVILRVMLSAKEVIELSNLPPLITGSQVGKEIITFKAGTPLSEVEKTMVIETLKAVNGNKLKAAEILGISRRSLYNKLEEYNIE